MSVTEKSREATVTAEVVILKLQLLDVPQGNTAVAIAEGNTAAAIAFLQK